MPHEREAVAAAGLGRKRAARRELRAIAKEILADRRRALARVAPIAAQLRREPPPPGRAPVTRQPSDVRALRSAVSFDHQFMTLMIGHLESAIAMAEREIADGEHAGLVRLARDLKRAYERELADLKRWLRTWYGEDGGDIPDDDGGGGGGSDEPRV